MMRIAIKNSATNSSSNDKHQMVHHTQNASHDVVDGCTLKTSHTADMPICDEVRLIQIALLLVHSKKIIIGFW